MLGIADSVLTSGFKPGLALRLVEQSDAEALRALILKNKTHLREWLGWLDGDFELPAVQRSVAKHQERSLAGLGLELVVCWHGVVVGRVSFNEIDTKNRKASIGYWLDKDAQGLGLMTESVAMLCGYGLGELNLNRLELRCATQNTKSQNIATRLGFVVERELAEAEWLYDHFVNHTVYSMLANDWAKLFPEARYRLLRLRA